MEKYGEYLLDAGADNIKECLQHLTEEDIESCCEYKIFNRGLDYFNDGRVEQIWYNNKANTISAEVIGTKEYSVEIYLDNEEVHGTCSCEYYGVCKHIIAVMMCIVVNGIEYIGENDLMQLPTIKALDFLKSHLQELSKEELINLVMKFAPENYILKIHNSRSDQKDANKIFTLVEKKILGFFKEEKLLWNPAGMESSLMGQLEKIKGFENILANDIGQLLLKIMQEVNAAFDEGYLYIDNHYHEEYFESPAFDHFVISYIRQLPFTDKMKFLKELDNTLLLMSYTTFTGIPEKYGTCFPNEELKKLTELIASDECDMNDSLISELFGIVEANLSIEVREKILTRLSVIDENHLISLTELQIALSRYQVAYDRIEMFLSGNSGYIENKTIELYLELCIKTGSDLNKAALVSINRNPNLRILHKIKGLGMADTKTFEDVLKDKNPEDLLGFLEEEKRFKEALNLISNAKCFYDDSIFSFFKKNKKLLISEAEQYFIKRIDNNLTETGDNRYSRIAETISQIKQINPALAKEILTDIRTNYKRRTKLISMLRRFD